MGRKRADSSASQTPAEPAREAPVSGERPGEASESGGSQPAPSKKEAVEEALAQGMTSPKEIAEHVKRVHGLDVTPGHVSTIKGDLKRAGQLVSPKGKPGRKPRQQTAVAEQAAPPSARGAGLRPQDLTALAEIAERVGGVEQLQQFLTALKRLP
jgi:hypothetical protein